MLRLIHLYIPRDDLLSVDENCSLSGNFFDDTVIVESIRKSTFSNGSSPRSSSLGIVECQRPSSPSPASRATQLPSQRLSKHRRFWIHLKLNFEEKSKIEIVQFVVDGKRQPAEQVVIVLMDSCSSIVSHSMTSKEDFFSKFYSLNQKSKKNSKNFEETAQPSSLLDYSLTITQLNKKWRGLSSAPWSTAAMNLFVDSLLGLLFMIFLQKIDFSERVSCLLLDHVDQVARFLLELLYWLMGAPVGLKLNKPLSQFLGTFFSFHVSLWQNYIQMLRGLVSQALLLCEWFGWLGFSLQLSWLSDFLRLFLLHIPCFYVYASRLSQLELFALSSLFRLFRGRKWNPLRKRVDTCQFGHAELFVGTVLFTITLFLLPTIFMFYAVFASLYIGLQLLLSILKKPVIFVESLNWSAFLQKWSDTAPHRLEWKVIQPFCDKDNQPLVLYVKRKSVSLVSMLFQF